MNAEGEPGTGAGDRSGRVRTTRARTEEWVVVGLGSNQGESANILNKAIARLEAISGGSLRRSTYWRTAPVDCPPGSADFLNAVVAWRRGEGQTPEGLLEYLQTLEQEFGRRPKEVINEPRPLDLDLIACGAELRNSDRLVLPHPRAVGRAFVLYPLAEILPDFVLPGQARTVRQVRDALGEAARSLVKRVDGSSEGSGS